MTAVPVTGWVIETARDGLGDWLVHTGQDTTAWVIAPPGVALSAADDISGWRLGCWTSIDGCEASLDSDPAWQVRSISTCEVLGLLPGEDHQFVLDTLLAQLSAARRVAAPMPGEVIAEDLARVGARAAAWVEAELAVAFPHERWPQHDPGAPFPLGPLQPPAANLVETEPPVIGCGRQRPQPITLFARDWLLWLLERHLPRVYYAARRRAYELLAPHGHADGQARAATLSHAASDGCNQSQRGELAVR
jgi:hypothetical protein